MEHLFRIAKKLIPKDLFVSFQPAYHYTLALTGALLYGFPSRKIAVIGVTGTKGKSTVAELLATILDEAGKKTALQTTVRFKIGNKDTRNLYKMTMPGRFFIQKFLRKAVASHCDYAILEITSEGAKQFRHTFIELDALIFTNLSPEHIESHGSYEAYRDAKLAIARKLGISKKKNKILVVNGDDPESAHFLKTEHVTKYSYHLTDALPYTERADGMNFTLGRETVRSNLLGLFNLSNMLAAATFARARGIPEHAIKSALEKFSGVPGRLEEIKIRKEQPFKVFVDYAHTPDSLKAVYQTFKRESPESKRLIGVLGNTGGGRDTWKRPIMGAIAGEYCDHIILTNEDPYDENPRAIIADMEKTIADKQPLIILDRRTAIHRALEIAKEETDRSPMTLGNQPPKVIVLITGKGTDPFIMGPNGSKEPWDDKAVAEEELRKVLM